MQPTPPAPGTSGRSRHATRHAATARRRRTTRAAGATSLLFVVLLAGLPGLAAAVTPAPSNRAVALALANALTTKALPSPLTPTLRQLESDPYQQEGAITYLRPSCNPYATPSEAASPQPCWYGASKPTDPVITIFGDSFVGNWMPALDYAAKVLGYRAADFEFQGCFTAFTSETPAPGFGPNLVAACRVWHSTLPAAVRRLQPAVVIAANGTPTWRVGQAQWVTGMRLAFRDLAPTVSTVPILIGTGIHLGTPAPQCLASSPGDIQACTFHYGPGSDTQAAFVRDAAVAAGVRHLHLIMTYQWVCRGGACPTVVDHVVVYVDRDHLSLAYSAYLSHVFLDELRAIL